MQPPKEPPTSTGGSQKTINDKLNMKKALTILFLLLSIAVQSQTQLSGTVTDGVDGEPVIGASIYFPLLKEGTVTDVSGRYSIDKLPKVKTTIQVSFVGHQTIVEEIDLRTTSTADFTMRENNAMLSEVVVTGLTGGSLAQHSPSPASVVSHQSLWHASATNVIDALSHVPGISQITTGSGISKPVIRGLGYNRIVVVNDGIRQEGQQWGDEHGIEIDADNGYSAEVLKGPASLMYGSDAMAGVIIFHDSPVMPKGSMKADIKGEYQSNSGLMDYSVGFAGNQHGWLWDWRWSQKLAHAYKNKYDGYVYGSQHRNHALSGMMGLNRTWGFSHLKLSLYEQTLGIVEGERDEDGNFVKTVLDGSEEAEVVATKRDFHSYGHPLPYQRVGHYKAVSENTVLIGDGNLHATIGYQQNRRREYEEVAEPNVAGLDFRLHSINYDIHYLSPENRGWKYNTGIGGMWQHSENLGEEYLIPSYHLFDIGAYFSATRDFGHIQASGGIRYDHRRISSDLLMEDDGERFSAFVRHYNGVSGSIGAIYGICEKLHLRLNLSHGFRTPNISELGSNGEHEGTFRYEHGNKDLKSEHSWQLDLGADISTRYISLQASLFANHINNYIYLEKELKIYDHAIEAEEEMPDYYYQQGDARLWGGELTVDIHPIEPLHFENALSYVRGVLLHQSSDSRNLPFMPAPRWTSDLRYDLIRDGRVLTNTFVSVGLETNFRQNHYLKANDTETATPSYTLLHLSAGTDILCHGKKWMTVSVSCENLTNRSYQSHLSRLKYAPLNQRTGRQGVWSMGRNICVKVQMPINL